MLKLTPAPFHRQIHLWLLRAVTPPYAFRDKLKQINDSNEDIFQSLGVIQKKGTLTDNTSKQLIHQREQIENSSKPTQFPPTSRRNTSKLANLIGLNKAEIKLLEFFMSKVLIEEMNWLFTNLGKLAGEPYYRAISIILKEPLFDIRKALSGNAPLRKFGLLKKADDSLIIDVENANLVHQLFSESLTPSQIMMHMGAAVTEPPQLSIRDYPHLNYEISLLQSCLKHAHKHTSKGVNILLHGVPGTGKTQLPRAIGRSIKCPVYECLPHDLELNHKYPQDRIMSLRFASQALSKSNNILVFDEAEDIFSGTLFFKSEADSSKATINQLLESNQTPVFWITNNIDSIDPSFLRRFNIIIEVPVPPRKQRQKIIQKYTNDHISSELVTRLSESPNLSPAVIQQSAQIFQTFHTKTSLKDREKAFTNIIQSTLKAQGHSTNFLKESPLYVSTYNLDYLNTKQNLLSIGDKLKQTTQARICLYGPSGTGKSSYAKWLQSHLDRPLIEKKASDLMSPFVGDTEQQIASAFREASKDGAILLIDEVDTFLQSRSNAHRSWEVSQVNEMLTQIESYQGILVCTSNLIDSIDQAAMRRFDLKLYFDYLTPSQVSALIEEYSQALELNKGTIHLEQYLGNLTQCTPGDFALLARQHHFSPFKNLESFMDALDQEMMHKNKVSQPIGFL